MAKRRKIELTLWQGEAKALLKAALIGMDHMSEGKELEQAKKAVQVLAQALVSAAKPIVKQVEERQ
jgi:hypothetical protein